MIRAKALAAVGAMAAGATATAMVAYVQMAPSALMTVPELPAPELSPLQIHDTVHVPSYPETARGVRAHIVELGPVEILGVLREPQVTAKPPAAQPASTPTSVVPCADLGASSEAADEACWLSSTHEDI